MKFVTLAILSTVAFSQLTLAQICDAQKILDTCLSMQDDYLRTCIDRDYPCLCKWHTTKLSCYDNCPSNLARASQQGLRDTYCSIADTYTNKTTAINSASQPVAGATPLPSAVPTSTAVIPNNNNSNTTASSSANSLASQGALLFVAGVTTYYLI